MTVCGSMLQGYEISKLLESCKTCVKSFSGAKMRNMQDYVKPTLRKNSDEIIVSNVGINDLASNKYPQQIVESIIGLVSSLKSDTCDVLVSSRTVRNDQHRKKVAEVNIGLKELCKEKKLYYINHEKKITVKHLNRSKLRLNRKGASILLNTLVESISNALQ